MIKVRRLTVPVGVNQQGQVISQNFSINSGKEISVTPPGSNAHVRYAVIKDVEKNEFFEIPLPMMGYSYVPIMEGEDVPGDKDVPAGTQGGTEENKTNSSLIIP